MKPKNLKICGRMPKAYFPRAAIRLAFSALLALGALALTNPIIASAQRVRVDGVVRDSSGASAQGAAVVLRANSYTASTVTDSLGDFVFENVPGSSGTILVTLKGFENAEQPWDANLSSRAHLSVSLTPVALNQQVQVTANRAATLMSDVPASNIEITRADLQDSPPLALDDDLRQVPGFSLFRRSSSRTANPTTQGVSLRGLGADSTSRALVLNDGIPLLDPFGGWVYWDRVPVESISSVEIAQEGASSLYGSDALGGVVQILTRPTDPGGISLETSYGNQNTPDFSLWAGGEKHGWQGSVAGEYFSTDGYVLVPASQRGSVDIAANSEHGSVDATIGRKFGESSNVFASGSYLDESRGNGTPLTNNDTKIGEGVLGANLGLGQYGTLALRFYADVQTYHQSYSSVALNRNSESQTDLQTVPAQGVGTSAVWSLKVGKRQTVVAGFDQSENIGASHDDKFSSGAATSNVSSGGRQRTTGIFGEDLIQIAPRWLLSLSARVDHWSNFDASMITTPIATPGPPVTMAYTDRSNNAFSPRATLLHQINSNVSWTASVYRAFRAPTLNELYRTSRVGNTLIESNPDLVAEHLTGGEAGVSVTGFNRRLEVRGTFFFDEIVDPIANVTLSSTSSLITRQKENLGRTNAPGVEIDTILHISHDFQLSTGYQYVNAKVSSYPVPAGGTSLVGLWVAQVPHNAFTFQARYSNPRLFTLSVDGRAIGLQYDDDLNQYPMGRFFVLDAQVSRSVGAGIQLFAAVENLLNESYATAATPVTQVGLPIAARFGFRFEFPNR
jgi:outer membrane receptor protein involved in Fe transport